VLDELIQPFMNLTAAGIRVLLIPGNHERSEFPFDLFHGIKGVHVFDRPKTVCLNLGGYSVGLAGFPFIRNDSRRTFHRALEETGYQELKTDLNILITHQAFDDAVVGPKDFVFRASRPDTVSRQHVPTDFDYIAAGHIHRYQVLPHPMKPSCDFVYPGSIQRISFAEMHEEKAFVEGEILNDRVEIRFIPLPAHTMEIVTIEGSGRSRVECEEEILNQAWRFSEDMVIRVSLIGGSKLADYPSLDFQGLRSHLPPAMECQFAVKTANRWVFR
jgi:DNA repair exonuclease SbcCD nuclease subunit